MTDRKAEEGRQAAERGRVEAEGDRVAAEGQVGGLEDNRRQAEAARVDAEHGRADAELGRAAQVELNREKIASHDRSWVLRNKGAILGLLLTAVVILTVACVALAVYARDTEGDLADEVETTQFEAVRNCIRANVLAGTIRLSTRPDPRRTETEARLARKLSENLFPLVDCAASRRTGRTITITNGEAEKYVAIVERARFPIVADGKVIGSRPSLLDGVNSIDDLGKP